MDGAKEIHRGNITNHGMCTYDIPQLSCKVRSNRTPTHIVRLFLIMFQRYMPDKTKSDIEENEGADTDSVALSKADIETATDSFDEEFSDSEHQCAICLTDYKEGDKICGSPNKLCQHQFHRTCITKWLMKKEECPYCRQKFLEKDGEAEEDTETTSTATSRPASPGLPEGSPENV